MGRKPAGAAAPAVGARLGWSCLAIIFVAVALLAVRQVGSLDIGFHLKAGEHIVSGNGWPHNDPFTFTVRDHPYIDTSWGYQVLVALANRVFGPAGLVFFHVGIVLALLVVLLVTARLGETGFGSLTIVLLLAGLSMEMRFEARPELLSYLFLAIVLFLLHRHAEGGKARLWLLVPLTLLWANVHALFVLGWIAEACFLVGLWLRDRRLDRTLAFWAAVAAPSVLVNPYGWKGVLFPLTLATRLRQENVFAQSISELTSPFALGLSAQFPFYPRVPIFAFRAFAALSLVALVPALRRRRWWCAPLWLAFMALSYKMIRNVPLLAVGCAPATAWGIAPLVDGVRGKGRRRGWLARTAVVACAAVAVLLALRVATDAYYVANRRTERFGLGWDRNSLPIEMTDFARRESLRGPFLNHLNFGGWMMYTLREPVFIDGRLEVIGETFFEEYRRALASQDALEASVKKYGIRWVVFPYAGAPDLLGRLSRDARWRLAHVDSLAAVFVRADSGALTRGAEGLPLPLPPIGSIDDLPGLGGGKRDAGLGRWLAGFVRRERFPAEDYNFGLFYLYRGEYNQAAARFARAIRASRGGFYEIYNNLAAALYRMKRLDEARACYRVVLEDEPDNRIAWDRLAGRGS